MPKKWIVGLGNPGKKYENTRHNAGFLFVEYLAHNWDLELDREDHRSIYGRTREGDTDIFLVQPQTFMNDSGDCLARWKRREGLSPADILVVYDDMDLDPGRVRYKPTGSGGSHNGMASIIETLGSKDFARLRIGVGRPADPAQWAEFVLRSFAPDEKDLFALALDKAGEGATRWIKGDNAETIMSKVNSKAE